MVNDRWGAGPISDTKEPPIEGPELVLHNPKDTEGDPYQDIPLMIFTKAQWKLAESGDGDNYIFSAAPVGPSDIGSNSRHVFALPPRWIGYTDAKGRAEVQAWMSQDPFQAPCAESKTSAAK